jgi:hypothetical protein
MMEPMASTKSKDMYERVVVDEKWFYMICAKERYYMVPTEIVPDWSAKNKDKIPKVMCSCVLLLILALSLPPTSSLMESWAYGPLPTWFPPNSQV